jgi:hypothetical protein
MRQISRLISLCKKRPTTALLSFLKQSFTTCKLLGFKNFESLVFGAFLSKTENFVVFVLALLVFVFKLSKIITICCVCSLGVIYKACEVRKYGVYFS